MHAIPIFQIGMKLYSSPWDQHIPDKVNNPLINVCCWHSAENELNVHGKAPIYQHFSYSHFKKLHPSKTCTPVSHISGSGLQYIRLFIPLISRNFPIIVCGLINNNVILFWFHSSNSPITFSIWLWWAASSWGADMGG